MRRYEKVMQAAVAEERDEKKIGDLVNGFSRTQLRRAIEELDSKKEPEDENRPLEEPVLAKEEGSSQGYKEALLTLKEQFPQKLTGGDGFAVRELFRLTTRLTMRNSLNQKQFIEIMRSRVAPDSDLGQFVRSADRKNMPLKDFVAGLNVMFAVSEDYLYTLKKFQDFNGKDANNKPMSANSFTTRLRQLASDLVEKQPGRHGESDEEAILARMREKMFTLMPAVAEQIIQHENLFQPPKTSFEFIGNLNRFRHSIERELKGRGRVNEVRLIQGEDEPWLSGGFCHLTNPEQDTVHAVTGQAGNQKPRTLQLTQSQLDRLKNVCYKCASLSPIQDKDHRSFNCVLYKDKQLASYVCSRCKLGVHLPSDCLQAGDKAAAAALQQRAKELNAPIKLEDGVNVVVIVDEPRQNQKN